MIVSPEGWGRNDSPEPADFSGLKSGTGDEPGPFQFCKGSLHRSHRSRDCVMDNRAGIVLEQILSSIRAHVDGEDRHLPFVLGVTGLQGIPSHGSH